MESMFSDLRVGLRSLLRTPGFAATAILTLAIGIGLSTAVFTVGEAMLLRRLPVLDQDRIVRVSGRTGDGRIENYPLGLDDARTFTSATQALSSVAFFTYEGAVPTAVRDGDRISQLSRALVSGDFFSVLGVQPVLGRGLRPEDDVRGAAPVAVLSHRAWQRRFGRAADIVGRRILTHEDGISYTIVGVMPQGLDVPRGTDFWLPVRAVSAEGHLTLIAVNVIGRLAPGATPAAARDEMSAFFTRDEAPEWQRELRGVVRTLPQLVLGDTRLAVLVFAAASAILLLMTCINVANLLLVRGLARSREIAVRSALGAGRARLVAHLLAEHALLAFAGGALGLLIAAGAVRGFIAFAPGELPRIDEVRLHAGSLIAAVAITGFSMLLFALAPAFLTSGRSTQVALRSGARHSAGPQSRRLGEGLVVGQVALAVIVLSGAALLTRSFLRLERVDLSIEPAQLLVAELSLNARQFRTPQDARAMLEDLVPMIGSLAGVASVSPVVAVPFSGSGGWDGRPAAEGQLPAEAATNPMLNMDVVSPDYFATLGVPVLRGRTFTDADREGAPAVVVLSQSAARAYWGSEDPVGRRLTFGPVSEQRILTVIGVVADTRYRELREARPSIYFPLRQSFFPFAPTNLVIRTTVPAEEVVPALRRVIAEASPGAALASAAPFGVFLEEPLAQPRMNALLLAVFAAAAVVLAAVGLFGVMAAGVRQRTPEFGMRFALGATGVDVAWLVLGRGLLLALAGSAIGLCGALAANRMLGALLFHLSPTDAVTLTAAAALLLAISALACIVPVRASTRIQPIDALRTD